MKLESLKDRSIMYLVIGCLMVVVGFNAGTELPVLKAGAFIVAAINFVLVAVELKKKPIL